MRAVSFVPTTKHRCQSLMSLFKKLSELLRNLFCWGKIPRAQVFIFYHPGSDMIIEHILKDIDYCVLDVRTRPHPINARVAFRLMAHLIARGVRHLTCHGPSGIVQKVLGDFEDHYYFALIKVAKPCVAITFIDNSVLFNSLALRCPKTKFIALQNGMRSAETAGVMANGLKSRNANATLVAGYFLGQQSIDLMIEAGIRVVEPKIVGSLKIGIYQEQRCSGPAVYDICLVSHWKQQFYNETSDPELIRYNENHSSAIARLNGFLKRYMDETEATMCIAMRYLSFQKEETDFYNEVFGETVTLLDQDSSTLGSYHALANGDVSIGMFSTLVYESMALGHKTLITNLTSDPFLDPPSHGLWSLENPSYEDFRRRLDEIRAMDATKYARETGNFVEYVIANNPANPPHLVVRDEILSLLSGRGGQRKPDGVGSRQAKLMRIES